MRNDRQQVLWRYSPRLRCLSLIQVRLCQSCGLSLLSEGREASRNQRFEEVVPCPHIRRRVLPPNRVCVRVCNRVPACQKLKRVLRQHNRYVPCRQCRLLRDVHRIPRGCSDRSRATVLPGRVYPPEQRFAMRRAKVPSSYLRWYRSGHRVYARLQSLFPYKSQHGRDHSRPQRRR